MPDLNSDQSKSRVALVDTHLVPKVPNTILSISDPCTSNTRQYLTHSRGKTKNVHSSAENTTSAQRSIYEVQCVSHPKAAPYSSFFVNSRVVSRPDVNIVTPTDPLYFLLPYFDKEEKWQPWNQIVQTKNISPEIMDALDDKQLKHFFEVNDSYSDDMILYKFNKDHALNWLSKKMVRLEAHLKKQLDLQKMREDAWDTENGGAFSSSFRLSNGVQREGARGKKSDEAQDKGITPNEVICIRKSAASIVCEYLSEKWQKYFLEAQSITVGDFSQNEKKTANSEAEMGSSKETLSQLARKRPLSQPKMSEAEKLLQYTMGSGEGASPEGGAKKSKTAEKSAGLKRLAKVNTKGMKSMTSFFSPKAKKKKD